MPDRADCSWADEVSHHQQPRRDNSYGNTLCRRHAICTRRSVVVLKNDSSGAVAQCHGDPWLDWNPYAAAEA
jgi:hypothetical protein